MRFSDIQLLRIVGWVTLAALLAGMMMSANLSGKEGDMDELTLQVRQITLDLEI